MFAIDVMRSQTILASATFDSFVPFAQTSANATTCRVPDTPVDAPLVIGICLAGFEPARLAEPDSTWAVARCASESGVRKGDIGTNG
jgi:hypothetical protein